MTIKGSVVIDNDGSIWDSMIDKMLAESSRIIALRGAGSFNGISKTDVITILKDRLFPQIKEYLKSGKVSVIYDGDNDDINYPDIGYIMGTIRDHFGETEVVCYGVQMLGWYKYRRELPALRPLHSAHNNEYVTILFPDDKFSGNHDHFSQNQRLALSPKYEQWYVGACGLIGSKQLADFSQTVSGSSGEHFAYIYRLPVSIEQEKKLQRKLENATNDVERKKFSDGLLRRKENPFGLLFNKNGEFLMKDEYSNLQLRIVY